MLNECNKNQFITKTRLFLIIWQKWAFSYLFIKDAFAQPDYTASCFYFYLFFFIWLTSCLNYCKRHVKMMDRWRDLLWFIRKRIKRKWISRYIYFNNNDRLDQKSIKHPSFDQSDPVERTNKTGLLRAKK